MRVNPTAISAATMRNRLPLVWQLMSAAHPSKVAAVYRAVDGLIACRCAVTTVNLKRYASHVTRLVQHLEKLGRHTCTAAGFVGAIKLRDMEIPVTHFSFRCMTYHWPS